MMNGRNGRQTPTEIGPITMMGEVGDKIFATKTLLKNMTQRSSQLQ
jgi:hypothetical protein